MENNQQLRITSLFLTVLVIGVIFMMLNAQVPKDPEDKLRELALTFRPIAIQMGGSAQLEGLMGEMESGATPSVHDGLEAEFKRILRDMLLSSKAEHTDSSFLLGAGMALAYQADELGYEFIQRIRVQTSESKDLYRILWCSSPVEKTRFEVESLAPSWMFLTSQSCGSLVLNHSQMDGTRLSMLPNTVRMRLNERALTAKGLTLDAREMNTRIREKEASAIQSVATVSSIPLFGGLIGFFLLLFHTRFRNKLKTFPGLSDTSLFPTEGIRAYLVLMGWFAFNLAFAILTQERGPLSFLGEDPGIGLAAAALASGLVSLVLIAHIAPQKRGQLLPALGLHTRGFEGRLWVLLIIGLLGYCAAVPITAGLSTLTQLFTGEAPVIAHPIIWMLADAESPGKVMVLVIGASILAPFFEEILFRGFLFQILRDRIGGTLSIVTSSLIFAALHPSTYTILPLFGLACLLCLLYARTGSLWPSILLHAVHNSVSVLLAMVTMGNGAI